MLNQDGRVVCVLRAFFVPFQLFFQPLYFSFLLCDPSVLLFDQIKSSLFGVTRRAHKLCILVVGMVALGPNSVQHTVIAVGFSGMPVKR